MKKVSNFLTGNSYSFATSTGDWGLVAPNNGTIALTGEKRKYADINSLKLVPSNTGPMSVRITGIPIPTEMTVASYRAGVWVASKDDVIADVTLYTTTSLGNASVTATSKVHGVHINRWTFVSVRQSQRSVQDDQPATISFDITFHNDGSPSSLSSEFIYITSPIISTNDFIYLDYANAETYLRLPEYFRTADEQQTDPQQYPLYRFIDVLNYGTSNIATKWWNYAYFPPFDVEDQKSSSLVDPNIAGQPELLWLARILGINLQNPPTGFSSWGSIESELDVAPANSITTWSEWQTPGSWGAIENLSPDTVDYATNLQWQVATAIYGINAGTTNAFKIATQKYLTGNKTVVIERNFGGDPWHIRIKTLVSETPDSINDEETGDIINLVAGTIPAGYQVTHRALTSL